MVKRNPSIRYSVTAAVALCLLGSTPAPAQSAKPLPHPIRQPGYAASLVAAAAAKTPAPSRWTPLVNQPSFLADGASSPILLTDGSVLIQDAGFPDWWRLSPDASGSYVNGTWSQIASLPATYSPLYHSSAVLPDGRLIIEGGEYLLSLDQTQLVPVWTAQGSIYDPRKNTWTPVAPPSFFTGNKDGSATIGDAQSVVLPDGTYMQANCCTTEMALLDPDTLSWRRTGRGKSDVNDEEGWTLLPNGQVLTVDAYVFSYNATGTNSELYSPRSGSWSSAGSTGVQLWDSSAACGGSTVASQEVGPGVLRPDGTVFYSGSNQCGAGHTAIYNSRTGNWTPGPDFPGQLDVADGPAALEPNGKVLVMASPGFGNTPAQFLEWDGRRLTPVAGPPNAPADSSFYGNMLVLPTGQILLTDFSNDIEIYTPAKSQEPEDTTHPTIASAPDRVRRGESYSIYGFGFNGVSQGAAYGDDAQGATNFPLVRLTNVATGHVVYARTHDHSSMAVASEHLVSTHFDVPPGVERGSSTLEVVVNGTSSARVPVLVQ